ncbi:hypothetical protein ENUP19_0001G0003 [Entamoeba nuttalli]|uniref:RhoGAP domain containing protein n=2 Tax=Entamoeba nuttalli TaxID=412467 RepID=K2HV95_ENTNP|nr:RhoGAP domain containing protein [Entamoeba nuttalli P19]EKE40110.1 RhoGAP domain containing protein [Entamoeba nuttalli P19]|eukprot:XP_008857556.1 RhoGAP domain containing protein [Entamoeba nuttalli P19]
MNDLKQIAHKTCLERYSKNYVHYMKNISEKAKQVSDELIELIPIINEFQKSIEEMKTEVNQSASQMSLFHELLIISSTNKSFIEILKTYENGIINLSSSLVQQNSWGETLSFVDDIKMQQTQMISNIISFQSFAKYIINTVNVRMEMNNYSSILQEEDCAQLQSAVTSLVNERKNLLNINYNFNTSSIIEKDEIPLPILKAMYSLYFSRRSLEGVFRISTDVNVIDNYMDFIGIIDTQTITNVDIANVIRKFFNTLNFPIWPKELLPSLLNCTKENENNSSIWIDNVRQLGSQIPKFNSLLLKHLLALCGKIAQTSSSKMDEYNLAVCIAISTLVEKDDVQTAAKEIKTLIKAFEMMIKNRALIFPDVYDCFRKSVNKILSPPIYRDIFSNKRQSVYFTRYKPKQKQGKTFNIGSYANKLLDQS